MKRDSIGNGNSSFIEVRSSIEGIIEVQSNVSFQRIRSITMSSLAIQAEAEWAIKASLEEPKSKGNITCKAPLVGARGREETNLLSLVVEHLIDAKTAASA